MNHLQARNSSKEVLVNILSSRTQYQQFHGKLRGKLRGRSHGGMIWAFEGNNQKRRAKILADPSTPRRLWLFGVG